MIAIGFKQCLPVHQEHKMMKVFRRPTNPYIIELEKQLPSTYFCTRVPDENCDVVQSPMTWVLSCRKALALNFGEPNINKNGF